MNNLLIISYILLGLFLAIYIPYKISKVKNKNILKKWRIGDEIILNNHSVPVVNNLKAGNKDCSLCELVIWDEERALIELRNGERWYVKMSDIYKNKSYWHRCINTNMIEFLTENGVAKNKSDVEKKILEKNISSIKNNEKSKSETVDVEFTEYNGKKIIDMNETELQIALKTSLKEEKYEIATAIKNILGTKFR